MDEDLKRRLALFLKGLVAFGYEWYSVLGSLKAGMYSTPEDEELIEYFLTAEELLQELESNSD